MAELALYEILVSAINQEYFINYKMSIWDVLYVERGDNSRIHDNRISSKHIDLLLCERIAMKQELLVELDDASHNRLDLQNRLAFGELVVAAAGLTIVRMKTVPIYSITELRKQIAIALPQGESAPTTSVPLSLRAAITYAQDAKNAMLRYMASKVAHAGKNVWVCKIFPR